MPPITIKQTIQKSFGLHEKDFGSPDVQIALLTKRILDISEHLKINKKDLHSRKGLVKLVSLRRKNIKYLESKDKERYTKVMGLTGLKTGVKKQ